MAPARMHVNSDSSLLDDVLRLHGTSLDGTQRQRFRGLGDDGQTERGHGSTTYDSRNHAAAIHFLHGHAPSLGTEGFSLQIMVGGTGLEPVAIGHFSVS